ncbi:MAG: efflux RND transporter periplasmic adaptor subunit [Thermodesulfobacteriota bacterium]
MKRCLCIAAIVFLVAATPVLAAEEGTKGRSEEAGGGAILVKAVQAEKLPAAHHRLLPGVVQAERQTPLSFRVPGLVREISVTVGQRVAKGQIIARLETEDYQIALDQAREALAEAGAQLDDARSQYERVRKLWADQAVSTSDLDSARAAYRSAKDQMAMASRNVEEGGRNLRHTDLAAPYDCIVADKMADVFQTVEAGQPVVLLVDPSSLEVRAQLAASVLAERNRFAEFSCVFPGLGGKSVPARLKGIGPSALPPMFTYPLTVSFSAPEEGTVLPGADALVDITVTTGASESLVMVPVSAIVAGPDSGTLVWLADAGAARPVPVRVEGLSEGSMLLSSGVSPGQWVITAGQSKLEPGAKVRLLPPGEAGQ